MATRTSSPPGSRSKSTSSSRSSGSKPRKKSSSSRSRSTRSNKLRRPAPRAVRSGRGPVARTFGALGRGVGATWMGAAHGVGAGARRIGGAARDLEPEHRRDGIGLFLMGLAVVVAAAVWWQLPGGVMDATRTVASGSVGKVGWLVPVMLVLIGWRNMRDPEHNGPAGRQVIGWLALGFGLLGIVHLASGNPQPQLGDASDLQFGRRGDRLRRLQPAARPAALGVRRRPRAGPARAVRRAGDHRDARLPGAGTARRAARPAARTDPARRGRRGRPDPADPSAGQRRHRPRHGRPGVRLSGAVRARAAQAPQGPREAREGGRGRPADRDHAGRGREDRSRAAAAHPDPAARRAARAVRRHHLHAARQRRAQAGLAAQGALEGQRRGRRPAHRRCWRSSASTPRSPATPAARP